MSRIVQVAVFTVSIALLEFVISAQSQVNVSPVLPKSGVVTLAKNAKVGDLIFQKGLYHVYCDHSNERHMMVFTKLDPKTRQKTRDVTMVPCEMKSVSGPITTTGVHIEPAVDGPDEMRVVSIRGDKNLHVLLDR